MLIVKETRRCKPWSLSTFLVPFDAFVTHVEDRIELRGGNPWHPPRCTKAVGVIRSARKEVVFGDAFSGKAAT